MVKINFNFIRQSQDLYSEVQSIAGKLNKPNSSVREVIQISQQLDKTFSSLNEIKKKAADILGKADLFVEIEEQLVNLHGKAHDALIERKIYQIKIEADSIILQMEKGNLSPKEIDALKKKIFNFLEDHRPCSNGLQIIAEAERTLKRALNQLEGRIEIIEDVTLSDGEVPAGICEDLMEIAELLYHGRTKEAKELFEYLPQEYQEQVSFDAQALVAKANHFANNGMGTPSLDRLKDLFIEVEKINWRPES